MTLSHLLHRVLVMPFRVGLDYLLMLIGLFNVAPLFRPRTARKKIAFQAYSTHLAQFCEPLITELSKEQERYEVVFIVLPHPHFSLKSVLGLRAYALHTLRLAPAQVRHHWQVLWERFDAFVSADLYAKFPLRRTRKYLLSHGPGVTTRLVRRRLFRPTLFDFDVMLLSGTRDANVIVSAVDGRLAPGQLLPVGLPYLDRLARTEVSRETYFRRLALDPGKPTVLVAPSWSGLTVLDGGREQYLDDILQTLRPRDFNVVVKLHACSYNVLMAGGINWRDRLQAVAGMPNVSVDYDVDDIPALQHADVLITDISSRAFNFMLLDRPVILYLPMSVHRDAWDRDRTALMRKGAFTAVTTRELDDALDRCLDPAAMRAERTAVVAQSFVNFGSATEAVINKIKADLNA